MASASSVLLKNRKFKAKLSIICHRLCATFESREIPTSQLNIQIHETLRQQIERRELTPKDHPGQVLHKTIVIPSRLRKATELMRERYTIPDLAESADKFARYLARRKPPIDTNDLRKIASDIELDVLNKEKVNPLEQSETERTEYLNSVKSKVLSRLRRTVYHWRPVRYNAHKSFLYMAARLAPEYAVLRRVFDEIGKRDPAFRPISLFDFGSGLGSVSWAANEVWSQWLSEHYCVDTCADMNTLARLLIQDGEEQKEMCFRGMYFRQFMPSAENHYDLVVSSNSLLELPNKEARIKTVLTLWDMTDDYLVLVENGADVGYRLLMEARKYILENGKTEGHVFAPCSHDYQCPRFDDGTRIPCNFSVNYRPLDGKDNVKNTERFTYLVLKKGQRDDSLTWPRLVRPVLKPSKHVHCHMCLSNGKLAHAILTAKRHGKDLYQCARQSECGDRLPVYIEKKNASDMVTTEQRTINTQDEKSHDDSGNTDTDVFIENEPVVT